CKLEFSDRPFTHHCSADTRTDNIAFSKRSIEDAHFSEFLLESFSDFKDAAFFTDIFTEYKYIIILFHRNKQGIANCIEIRQFNHCLPPHKRVLKYVQVLHKVQLRRLSLPCLQYL